MLATDKEAVTNELQQKWVKITRFVAVTLHDCVCVSSSPVELEKGIKGLVVMSSSFEGTFDCIHDVCAPLLLDEVPDDRTQ